MSSSDPFNNVVIPIDNTPGSFMTGVDNMNRVFGNMSEGIMQKGSKVLNSLGVNTTPFDNQLSAYRNNLNAELAQENAAHPIAAGVGNVAGILGSSMAYGGGLLKSSTLLGRMAANAGLVGLQSYLRYTEPDQSALGNAAKGAAASLAFTPVSAATSGAVNKVASYLTPEVDYGNILNRATGYGLFSAYKAANNPENSQYYPVMDKDNTPYLSAFSPDSINDTQGQLLNNIANNGANNE